MKKTRITSVEINDSLNPMHYIRSDDDINIYINNLLTNFPEKGSVTKPAIQLIHICLQFIIYSCRPTEWNSENLEKLLIAAKQNEETGTSPLEIIFEDLAEETAASLCRTYRNYTLFKRGCEEDAINPEEAAELARKIIDANTRVEMDGHAPRRVSVLKGLRKPSVPLQATVETEDGKTYVLYFWKTHGTDIRVKTSATNEPQIEAVVYAIHPFLHNLGDEARLSDAFLNEILDLCDAKTKKNDDQLAWIVENAFKDDSGDDLDEILEYDPNRPYKLRSKDDTGTHEAGHAVFSWLFNAEIEQASITRDRVDRTGHVSFEPWDERLSDSQTQLISIFRAYAGDLASTNRSKYVYWRSKASQDTKKATGEAKLYVSNHSQTLDHWFVDYNSLGVPKTFWVAYKTSLLCEYIYNRTHEIVNANRDLIDALAEKLCKKKTMTGTEIDAYLSSIDPTRKGSLIAILPEEEKTIDAILNPYKPPKPENKENQ